MLNTERKQPQTLPIRKIIRNIAQANYKNTTTYEALYTPPAGSRRTLSKHIRTDKNKKHLYKHHSPQPRGTAEPHTARNAQPHTPRRLQHHLPAHEPQRRAT